MSAKRIWTLTAAAAALLGAAGDACATTLRDLPRGARAGECYSHVAVPAAYRTERQPVPQPPVVSWREVPAVYRTQSRQVLVSPARVDHETIPAVMGSRMHWEEHAGPDRIVEAPPVYRWEVRRVMVAPAHLVWRRSDTSGGYGEGYGGGISVRPTGEVMCRVMVPARYEIRRVRVLVSPARTCVVKGPVTRERIVEHFVVRPARVIDHSVAAVYRTVTERVLVSPARRERVETPQPPRYVEHRVLVTPARTDWRRIVCTPPRTRSYASPAPAPAPTYGQPYTPTYAQPRPGELDGAPTYRAPSAEAGEPR